MRWASFRLAELTASKKSWDEFSRGGRIFLPYHGKQYGIFKQLIEAFGTVECGTGRMVGLRIKPFEILNEQDLEEVFEEVDTFDRVGDVNPHVQGVIQAIGQLNLDELRDVSGPVKQAADILIIGFTFKAGESLQALHQAPLVVLIKFTQQFIQHALQLFPFMIFKILRPDIFQNIVQQGRQNVDDVEIAWRLGIHRRSAQRMEDGHGAQAPAFMAVGAKEVIEGIHDDGFVLFVLLAIAVQGLAAQDETQDIVTVH